jgi:hypothetical protein
MMRTRTLKALTVTGALLLTAIGPAMAAGGPPDDMGGGGGQETEAGNNLSFPVLWSEAGATLTLRGTMDAPVVEGVVLPGHETTDPESAPCLGALQKDVNNTWQADNLPAPGNIVTTVDWGDSLESTDANPQKQRVETSLYAVVDPRMTRYEMCYISGEGRTEVWGLRVLEVRGELPEDPITYAPVATEGTEAMVYTAGARLTIQRIDPARTYTWDSADHQWTGCGARLPIFNAAVHEKSADGPGSYGAEVTVSGKITYGYNWNTANLDAGEYRLTFSLDGPTGTFPGTGTSLSTAQLLPSGEAATVPEVRAGADGGGGGEDMGNTAVLVGDQNLTYIDVGVPQDPGEAIFEPDCSTTPPPTGGGTSTPAAPAPAPAASVAPTTENGQPQVTTPQVPPQAAKGLIAQNAKIKAPKSGKYPVGTTIVLAKKPVKTDVGVTVRWRATKPSLDNCVVKVRKGTATATFTDPGRCRVVAWAPAASPDYLPFKAVRTYTVTR